MPYTIQARMSQFGDCTDSEPYIAPTFEGALIFLKGALYGVKSRMWEHIMPNYTYFMGGLGPDRYHIDEVTNIPEQDSLYIIFGSSHSNCECWSFEVTRSE